MEWMAAYLLLGAVAGLLGGLFGIGGGTVLVPVLLFLFDAQHFPPEHLMHLALGTSMATIIFTATASLYKHHQHNAVNWHVVRTITPGILIGTALGTLLAAGVPTHFLGLFFALFVYFAAAQILLDLRPHASRQLPGKFAVGLFGVFTGSLSSLVSIGGGTLVIPYLLWSNLTIRQAIGTSAAISFPVAIGGTAGYVATGLNATGLPPFTLGYVYLPCLLFTALASVITAPLGARAAHRININVLRKLFAVLLLSLATKLLFKVLG
ncbi:MAG: sulfite exporter TauE/SafE family protein [Proteobacteria bacterium]|nr:sulfite exporter TauE/SafE family protein [Pseudomonadota bacterium]